MSKAAFLKRVSIFSGMDDGGLQKLETIVTERTYTKKSIIFHEGDIGDSLYIIKAGRIKIAKVTLDGREKTLTIMQPGDFFGEMALFDNMPRSATAEVIEGSAQLYSISKTDFERLIHENPSIALKIMRDLTQRIRQVNQQVEDLAFKDVHGRVATTLCQLAEKEGRPMGGRKVRIELKMTHQDIASMVGSSRETVTRALNRFQERGIISIEHQHVTILKPRELEEWT